MTESNQSVWSRIGYWIAEIAIVFIGVYLAFLLSGYRTNQQNKQKKQQIYTALYHSFSNSAKLKKRNSAADSLYVRPFLTAYRNNEMPQLKKWPFLTLAINNKTWTAMLQSGGISLLDITLIQRVSNFYHHVELLRQESTRLNKMSDQYLVPHISADINTFYNTKTQKLRPRYEWYIHFIKYYQYAINYLTKQSKEILKLLRKRMNRQQLQKISMDSTLVETE